MARNVRLHRSGAFYHVMLRGNNGQKIFFSPEDYCKFCLLIQEVVERFRVRVHGFCFMTNHAHLVLQVSDITISKIIQNLAFRYTRYINFKEKRIGHLFQGRFKSILVEDGEYLLELIRYVHLNPLRAKMTLKPEDYLWSGHRAYLGMSMFTWLTLEHVFGKFDTCKEVSRECYRRYINRESFCDMDINLFNRGNQEGGVLGSKAFACQMEVLTDNSKQCTLKELIGLVCKVLNQPVSIAVAQGKNRIGSYLRAIIAYFVKEMTHLTLKEFADFVGRDISSVSKPAGELELKLKTDGNLALTITKIRSRLNEIPISQA